MCFYSEVKKSPAIAQIQAKAKAKPAINTGMFTSAAPMTMTGTQNIPEIIIVAASSVELSIVMPLFDPFLVLVK